MARWWQKKLKSIGQGPAGETPSNYWAPVRPNPTQTEQDELYHADAKRAQYFSNGSPFPPTRAQGSLQSLQDAIQGSDNHHDIGQPTTHAPEGKPMTIALRVETIHKEASGYVVGHDSGAWIYLDPFIAAQIIEGAEDHGLVWIRTGNGVEAVRGHHITIMEIRKTDGSLPTLQWDVSDISVSKGNVAVDEMSMSNPDESGDPRSESTESAIVLRALPARGDSLAESQISHLVSLADNVGITIERVSDNPGRRYPESPGPATEPHVDIPTTVYTHNPPTDGELETIRRLTIAGNGVWVWSALES